MGCGRWLSTRSTRHGREYGGAGGWGKGDGANEWDQGIIGLVLVTCSQMLYIKNKATQLLVITDLRLTEALSPHGHKASPDEG
jgi:hypothetical protein